MKKVASLQYEVIFKKAFSQPEIFKGFVRDMLGIELDIDVVETEKRFETQIGQVDVRFDLFAEDKKNRTIVEIQHEKRADHYERFFYYHCTAVIEQVTTSTDYSSRLQVFTIVVLTGGDKHKRAVGISDFDPRDPSGQPFGEINHKILFLCPKYANENTPPQYREWLQAIADSLDGEIEEDKYENPLVLQVFDSILSDQPTPLDRTRMKDEYGTEQLIEKKRQEGIE